MSFSKRKADRRKPDARPLAASAEVCETRALLSADGASLTIEEIVDMKAEDATAVDAESGDEQIVPEIAICTMLPVDLTFVDDVEGQSIDGEPVLFTCGVAVDGETVDGEIVDGEVLEDVPVEFFAGEESLFGVTTVGDWDPAWAIRSFVVADDNTEEAVDGEVVDGEVTAVEVKLDGTEGSEEFVDVTTLEDWNPSWAYRGVVIDEEFSTTDDSELVTDEVTDENVIFFTMGVLEKDGDAVPVLEECEFQAEVLEAEVLVEDSGEAVAVADGEVKDGEEVVDVESEFVEAFEGELEDLIRFNVAPNFRGNIDTDPLMASAAGGVLTESPGAPVTAVMGPAASGGSVAIPVSVPFVSVPVTLPQTPVSLAPVAIPVSLSSFRPLFEAGQESDTIGTLIAHLPEDASVSSDLTDVVVESGLESGLSESPSESLSSLDSGLEVLDTLLEEESTESDSETPSEPAHGEVAPEETVTSTNVTPHVVAPPVVAAARPAFFSSERLTDRFMTEFAVNGFLG